MAAVPTPASAALLCPALIGRDAELAQLREALDLALDGLPQAILLAGEAGLGKSRLRYALADEARARGMLVVAGHAAAQDAGLPHGLFVDALGHLLRSLPGDLLPAELLRKQGPALSALLPLLPELQPHLDPAPAETAALTPAVQRRRLLDAVVAVLSETARRAGGLALLLENLHWADESSLDLLGHLLRTLGVVTSEGASEGTPMLVLGTYRSEAVAESQALGRALAQIAAQRLAREIRLRPLTPEEHDRLLAAIFARFEQEPPAALGALYARTEGNPFFTEEVLGALATNGLLRLEHGRWVAEPDLSLHLPLSLRATVLDRLEGLDEEARETLSFAAVIGRDFDFELLREVTGLDERTLLTHLRRAVARQLLREAPPDLRHGEGERYRFRHALTREAIYDDLLGGERRRHHRAIAQAIERAAARDGVVPPDSPALDQLAYHYEHAGVRDRAAHFARLAGDRATDLLAYAEARHHYEAAFQALDEQDPARPQLAQAVGTLSMMLFDIRGALQWLERAVDVYRVVGRPRRAGLMLALLGRLLWHVDGARFRAATNALLAAGEAAGAGHDGGGADDADTAGLYASAAILYVGYDQHRAALAWAQRAVEISEALAAQPAPAPAALEAPRRDFLAAPGPVAVMARGLARINLATAADLAAGLADLERALELSTRESVPQVSTVVFDLAPYTLFLLGRDREARALVEASIEHERRSGAVTLMKPHLHGASGRPLTAAEIDELQARIAASRQSGARTVTAVYQVGLAHALLDRGDRAAARAALEEALPILEPFAQFSYTLGPCLWGLARLHALEGRPEEAARLYERCHALWRTTGCRALATLVLLDAACFFADQAGEHGEPPTRARRLLADLEGIAAVTQNAVALTAARHAAGVVALAEGQAADALAPLRLAVEGWALLERPFLHARALARLGAGLLAASARDRGQRAEAERTLAEAEQRLADLGATDELAHLAALRHRANLATAARRRRAATTPDPFASLTSREREVLALLAAGLKNREIAAALSIAETTAELHVSRVLGKLGVATRTQAAALAIKHGLPPPADPAADE